MSTTKMSSPKQGRSARQRLALAAAPGIMAGIITAQLVDPFSAVMIGWEVMAAIYLAEIWHRVHTYDAGMTARHASTEDPGIALSDGLLTVASLASLGAVIGILTTSAPDGGQRIVRLAVVVAGLVLSWLVIHSVFMLRYARLYYTEQHGGINFNQTERPRYSDFAYLAFTLGMTFQVSDTSLTLPDMRRTALTHALLSYLFGTVILASAINLIAGLGH